MDRSELLLSYPGFLRNISIFTATEYVDPPRTHQEDVDVTGAAAVHTSDVSGNVKIGKLLKLEINLVCNSWKKREC